MLSKTNSTYISFLSAKPKVKLFALLSAFLIITSCQGHKQQEQSTALPLVTVSIPPQEWFVRAIGGDSVMISTLMPQGSDPETFEPGIKQLSAIGKSDVYLAMGYLPFETAALKNIKANNPELRIKDLSEGIVPIYGTHEHLDNHAHGENCRHDHGHVHDGGADPHTWSSVTNAKIIAKNVAEALKEVDPQRSSYYEARYKALSIHLDSLDNEFRQKVPERTAFAIWHPSLSYMARDYGLKQIAVGLEGKESSVAGLRKRIDATRGGSVRTFFVQRDIDPRQAETAREESGVEMVVINPLSEDWEGEMKATVEALTGKK